MLSVLLGTAAILPTFQAQKSGHILNISSDADRKVFPGSAVYSATKAAVSRFTEGVRLELSQDGFPIHLSSLSPGAVVTELASHITDKDILDGFSKGKHFEMLQAKDIADLAIFVLSRDGRVNIENVFVKPQEQFF
jgi:NADP-dependent 3-hydroxy acid dehydrogenase YdfG